MKLTTLQSKVLQAMADYDHGCAIFGAPSRIFRCGYSIELRLPILHTYLHVGWFLRCGFIERVEGPNNVYRITTEGRRMLE